MYYVSTAPTDLAIICAVLIVAALALTIYFWRHEK